MSIWKRKGISGFYRANSATCLREVRTDGIHFGPGEPSPHRPPSSMPTPEPALRTAVTLQLNPSRDPHPGPHPHNHSDPGRRRAGHSDSWDLPR